ncbi:hypothetical protein [Sporosarcina sp. FSL W7-1283]|uniref:hypothetical protein n=1 Tax=Sporosarcina sp. FSL W7-1283 TaxID=2921560 RepID=UPI0030F95D6B
MSNYINKQNNKKFSPPSPPTEEELKKQKFVAEQQKMFSSVQRSIIRETNKHISSNSSLGNFTTQQVTRFLQNPIQFEKQLRQLSNYLYNVSGNYKRIIQYFALLPTYAYTIEPYSIPEKYNKEKYKKEYFKVAKELEKMSLRHELTKIMKIAFKEDVFYGYIIESKDTFFIMHLDADYCKITSLSGEDGLFNFSFDFSFFDRNKDVLSTYPEEFQQKYQTYLNDTSQRFIELSSDNAICIKVNDEIEYPLIPFSTIFESIFEADQYKKIKMQKTKMDNFLLLTQKIPQGDKNEVDMFTINLDLAGQFHDMLSQSVPEGISVALSPMEITATRMEKSRNDQDVIQQSQRDIYSAAGVPQQIFNSEKNTAVGINKSIVTAEQILFGILRQVERWVNRRLSKMNASYKFHLKFLDITVFNQKEKQDQLQKAATSSMPVINEYAASLGMSPLDLYNKAVLENEVLSLHDLLKPLQSTHTQSGKDNEGGRDKVDDDVVNESTEQWRETDDAQGES